MTLPRAARRIVNYVLQVSAETRDPMRDPDDLFTALARSPFRNRQVLSSKDRIYLRSRGLEAVLHHAEDFVARRLAPAEPPNDGKQTPWRGHPVFTAQHATATCCRACLSKWHRIEPGRVLTADEQRYIVGVIRRWLEQQDNAEQRPDDRNRRSSVSN